MCSENMQQIFRRTSLLNCVKSVHIRSLYFPAFRLDTDSVFSPNVGEIRTRITPNTDTFHAVSANTLRKSNVTLGLQFRNLRKLLSANVDDT